MIKLPAWNSDSFLKVASGCQSVLVSLAILVGGVWTLYTFLSLKSIEKARQELEQLSHKRAVVDVHVKTEAIESAVGDYASMSPTRNPRWLIHVVVTVKNSGNNQAVLDLSNDSLFLKKLRSATDAKATFSPAIRHFGLAGVSVAMRSVVVLPGSDQELHYVVDVEEPGMYLVEFRIPMDPALISQYKADAINRGGTVLPEVAGSRQYVLSAVTIANVTRRLTIPN
jgi:hypothetical protein